LAGGTRTDTKKMVFKNLKFERCDLSRSAFVKCVLKEVILVTCNLKSVVFDYCDLRGLDLSNCDTEAVNYETSQIGNTKLSVEGFVKFGYGKGFVLGE